MMITRITLISLLISASVRAYNPSLYELSTRPWLYYLSQKYGQNINTLSAIPQQEFQWIADAGFDYVWMMGVWELGEYGLNYGEEKIFIISQVKDKTNPSLLQFYPTVLQDFTIEDVIGSPYAVVNYTCNSQLGSDDDIATLRSNLNQMGLKLMLDFVPNHSAVDCPYTTTNPDLYINAPKGTPQPYDPSVYLPNGIAYGSAGWGGAWQDTAQFNYWNPDTVKIRVAELLHVASLSDAIRCDMAYLLINSLFGQNWESQLSSWNWTQPKQEWWSYAIQTVKAQYPDVIFLAEVYDPYQSQLQQLGFDYTYDKDLYDRLTAKDSSSVKDWLSSNSVSYLSQSAHFVSNHDQPRAAENFGSWWAADAAALITFTVPGMRFYWQWQFSGFSHQIDIHLRRETNETPIAVAQSFYKVFLNITNTPIFKEGTWTYLNVDNDSEGNLIAYKWNYGDEKILCVMNYGDVNQEYGSVVLSDALPINGNETIPVTELLTNTVYYRNVNELRTSGLDVFVNSWFGQIFSY